MSDFGTLTNDCYSVQCFANAIQKYLLPHNIYWVPIFQYSDANTSSTCQGSMCQESSVSNLLTAGDKFGMHFLFWFPTWGFDGGGESASCEIPVSQSGNAWQTEVLNHWATKLGVPQSSLAEVDRSGGTVCVLRQDYVWLWTQQVDRDISEVYDTYGSHPSLAGFLQYWEFSVGYHSYSNTGYSAQTQANFSRSQFYPSGCLQCYLQAEFQQALNNVAAYCRTLSPSCVIMSDEAPTSSPEVANYYGYSLTGSTGQGWPSTYGAITNEESPQATCSPTYNCGISNGFTTNGRPLEYSNYIAGEAIGFRCYSGTLSGVYSCNNAGYNPTDAIPYELAASYPNQITPLVWLQTSAYTLVSNFTMGSYVPPNLDVTPGQDYLYNERYFANVAANTVYLGRQTGYSSKPLANILLVNSDPQDTNYAGNANFLTEEFLISIGFNVTAVSVSQVKDLNLLQFNAILWTSTDQPNETNETTYNDLVNAINNGVGFVLADNAGTAYGGGTGIASTTLNNLFGLVYPVVGCCWIPHNPAPVSEMTFDTTSSVAKKIFSPYDALSMSDFVPNVSPPKEYAYSTTSTFTAKGGVVLATATDSDNARSFPVMVAVNGTGPGKGRMLWLGTTYDTSGLYGSYVSSGLYTKQLDVYVNMLLYASQKDSLIPYIYTEPSQPSYYPGITFSILGSNAGSDLVWFSDYSHTSGGTASISIDYKFRASAMGIRGNWIAINLANMAVVNQGSSATIALPLTMRNETWAPVYVSDLTPISLGAVYSNSVVKGQTIGASSATYSLSGPFDSGSWLVVSDSNMPTSVSAGGTPLTMYSSLGGLVSVTQNAYMQTNANNWAPATGWYFDPVHDLVYVAYVGSPNASVEIDQPTSVSTTTTSTTSSSVTTSTVSSSVTTSTASVTTSSSSGFSLGVDPSSMAVVPGGSASASVAVNRPSPGAGAVTLSASQLPPGVVVSFSPQFGTSSYTSTMTVSTSAATPLGVYDIGVTGTDGFSTEGTSFSLSVTSVQPTTFSLTISSQPAQGGTTDPPPGTAAYAAGSNISIRGLPAPGWSLSSWTVNGGYAGNGTKLEVQLEGSTSVSAVFVQTPHAGDTATVSFSSALPQATVGIDGHDYSLPVSFDWALGSTHTFSSPSVVQVGNGTKAVFTGWSGSQPSSSASLTLTVGRNLTLIQDYKSAYLTRFDFVDANSHPMAPTEVSVQGAGARLSIPANMTAWLYGGTYKVIQAEWMGENVVMNYGFKVTHPGNYTIPLLVYSDTVKVTDVYGVPISGATVRLSTGNGMNITGKTGPSGTVTFEQVPLGTYAGTVTYLGVSAGITSSAVGNNATTVTLVLSYPFFLTLIIFGVLATFLVYRRRRRAASDRLLVGYWDPAEAHGTGSAGSHNKVPSFRQIGNS